MKNEIYEVALDKIEKIFPDVWSRVYPRIYEEPRCGKYYSPKTPAQQLSVVAVKIIQKMWGRAEQYEFLVASHLVKYSMPIFWIGADMATALRQTEPPGDIPWYTMPLPFPAALFMIPKGALVHPDEGDVTFIGYCRLHEGEIHESQLIPGNQYGSMNGGMVFVAHTAEGKHFYHWNMPLDHFGPSVTIPDIDKTPTKDSSADNMGFFPTEMTPADNHMMLVVVHYCLTVLMLMQSRPELTTHAHRLKTVKKGDKVREFWSPNIIGEHYRIKQTRGDGQHASPRWHWVRGFWRQQPHGPGRDLRKDVWIEPYTRGI
jgi:hypothetical protein